MKGPNIKLTIVTGMQMPSMSPNCFIPSPRSFMESEKDKPRTDPAPMPIMYNNAKNSCKTRPRSKGEGRLARSVDEMQNVINAFF
jgi:hypothetical protein